jgi:apolipoprotein N-acyltransferase
METIKDKAEELTDDIGDYIETYYKLKVLQLTDKAANVASVSLASIMILVLGFFFMLFLGIGLGWWIGERLDNMVAGFCIIAGIYAVLILIVLVLRKNLILPYLRNLFIRKAYE